MFDVGKVDVSVVLLFIADHGEQSCHSVVDKTDAAIPTRMMSACRDFVYTQKLNGSCYELSAELGFSGRQESGWASPEENKTVHQYVGGSFVREFCGGDGVHVRKRLKQSVKRRMKEFHQAVLSCCPK